MDDLSLYVPNVHFEQIPIKNLVSNQDYQRNLSQSHIERAAAHFDLYQINPVKVSRRDGINYFKSLRVFHPDPFQRVEQFRCVICIHSYLPHHKISRKSTEIV